MLTDQERWGRLIRAARETQLFLTQAELAERITDLAREGGHPDFTLDQSAVSRWEKGHSAPKLKFRPYIAKALDIPVDVLFQRSEQAA